jgi:Ammonium Transporter Family.
MGADNTAPVTGLFYGGGLSVLEAQAVGSAIVTIVTFAVAMVVMLIVAKLPYPWKLRIEPHGETGEGGIDVFEHGSKAYY